MKVHDWTRVEGGVFHDFHLSWVVHLCTSLNHLLPPDHYARIEPHMKKALVDLLVDFPDVPSDAKGSRRTLTIRHITGHRIIALVEIISPSNKSGERGVAEFVQKAVAALRSRIHLVFVDLFPPGRHDPQGMHAAIWEHLDAEAYELPADQPLTLASYAAGTETTAYVEHRAVGDPMPVMPLFLTGERYVNLPLASTYEATFCGLPDFWIDVLDKA